MPELKNKTLNSYGDNYVRGNFIDPLADSLIFGSTYNIINNKTLAGNYSEFSIKSYQIDNFLKRSIRNICNSYIENSRSVCAISTDTCDANDSINAIYNFDDLVGRYIDKNTKV